MGGSDTCRFCKCPWTEHMHIFSKKVVVRDKARIEELRNKLDKDLMNCKK